MSTFGGRMEEIDYISIDNFEGDNLKSLAFFLSHCHTDHMHGIKSRDFECALQNNNTFLYMSSVSKTILEKLCPQLSSKIKVLETSDKNFIEIPKIDKTIAVTLIPAGHCPGSVMFLFETDKNLLYTGDIRIRAKELQKYKQLFDSASNLKRIDNIYLDTTFFLKCYEHFPLREQSISEFCKLINQWLEKDKENIVAIETPANYGSEYLFTEIFKKCNQQIHVARNKYDLYIHFPEMDNAITLNGKNTRIHNECIGRNFAKDICNDMIFSNKNRLNIKPSALCWTNRDFKNCNIVEERKNGIHHVCYSSHSSYTELIDILKFLKPLKISPCVIPQKESDNNEMLNTIKEILEDIHSPEESSDTDSEELFKNKTNWTNENYYVKNCSEEFNDDNKELFNFLDSPDSKKRKKTD